MASYPDNIKEEEEGEETERRRRGRQVECKGEGETDMQRPAEAAGQRLDEGSGDG